MSSAHTDASEPTEDDAPTPAWRYVIPNAVTCASLVLGLAAMIAAVDGRFEAAGWFIVWCVLFDKLDGTFARLLNASSKFGVQLDSLADLVVFGVSPAAVLMLLSRSEPEIFGAWGSFAWVMRACLALFVVCAALRLAKFNVMSEGGPKVFFGMPTTLAGGLLGLLLLVGLEYDLTRLLAALPLLALVFGLMMVSNLPLPKVTKRDTAAGNYFQIFNLVACYACGFARVLPEYLLLVTIGYAGVGFVWGALHRRELLEDTDEGEDGLELQPS